MPGNTPFVRALRERLRGRVSGADDPGFDEQRQVWNGAIDRRPAAMVRCADAHDVRLALAAAREFGVPVTVRGGGHNVAGLAVQDAALQVDLSAMRDVQVHAARRIAVVQGGALWRDLDAATAPFGLATTGGMVSSTGVSGLTLGGGVGWLMRRFGLSCDNLLGADLILADGRMVRADPSENPDLFWGLRGGAGRLGVVTQLELRLHPVSNVLAGPVIYAGADAAAVLRRFRDVVADAPDEFCGLAVLTSAPPVPFLDTAWHGRPVCILALCWSGDPAAGETVLAPLRCAAPVLADAVCPMPYVQWQQLFDHGAPAGRGQYWKSANFTDLSDSLIETLAQAGRERPSPFTELHLQHLGGAVTRIPSSDGAFAHRDVRYFVNLLGAEVEGQRIDGVRAWVRALHARLAAEALPGRMPNFSDGDDQDAIGRFGKDHARRLQELRTRYDPENLFAASRQPLPSTLAP